MKRPSKKTLVRGCQLYSAGGNKFYNISKHFPNEFALSIMRSLFIRLIRCYFFFFRGRQLQFMKHFYDSLCSDRNKFEKVARIKCTAINCHRYPSS